MSYYHLKIKDYGNGLNQVITYKNAIVYGKKRLYTPRRNLESFQYELLTEVADNKKTMKEAVILMEKMNKNKLNSKRSSNSRAKNKFYDIVMSNEWEWFVTLTLSPEYVDRENQDEVKRIIKYFLDETRRDNKGVFKYVGVPEYHSDGKSLHFHFLFSGLSASLLSDSNIKTFDNHSIYNLKTYKFGFSTVTLVRDTKKASAYLTKYMSKTLEQNIENKKRYWASRNLNRPTEHIIQDKIEIPIDELISENNVNIRVGNYSNNIKYQIINYKGDLKNESND